MNMPPQSRSDEEILRLCREWWSERSRNGGSASFIDEAFAAGFKAAASEKPAHEGYDGIAHDVEQAWQMLEVCGVPRERAKNNLARGIEVLSTRLGREEHFQKAMEADAQRYRRLKDASGRTWDKLAGAHITGQLDKAIDTLGDDE